MIFASARGPRCSLSLSRSSDHFQCCNVDLLTPICSANSRAVPPLRVQSATSLRHSSRLRLIPSSSTPPPRTRQPRLSPNGYLYSPPRLPRCRSPPQRQRSPCSWTYCRDVVALRRPRGQLPSPCRSEAVPWFCTMSLRLHRLVQQPVGAAAGTTLSFATPAKFFHPTWMTKVFVALTFVLGAVSGGLWTWIHSYGSSRSIDTRGHRSAPSSSPQR
jgi:hypothetical protein